MAPGASRREVAGTSASIVLSQVKTPHFSWRTKVGALQWAHNGGGVAGEYIERGTAGAVPFSRACVIPTERIRERF
jgi:hypothetical protein